MGSTKPAQPFERRTQKRERLEDFEKYSATIAFPSGNMNQVYLMPCQPFDLNAFGMGCTVRLEDLPKMIHIGMLTQEIDLKLCGKTIAKIPSAVLCSRKENRDNPNYVDLGFRFNYPKKGPTPQVQERPESRLKFHAATRPQAFCSNPLRFGETINFEIEDLSLNGARLVSSIRNRLLWKGLELDQLRLNIPGLSQITTAGVITYVSKPDNENRLHIGFRFKGLDSDAKTALVQASLLYAELDQNEPLENIRSAGFKPKYIRDQLEFSYSSSPEEYQQILKLRLEAYRRAGKVSPDTTAEQMADEFDKNSKIIVAKFRGEVVGSMRITRCLGPHDKFELDASITLPKKLPRLQTIEISRLCVDNRFENTDVVLGLIERATILGLQLGVKRVITSCVTEMLPYYAKMGFYPTGLQFKLETLGGIPHHFLMADSRTQLRSYKLNPLYWMYTFKRSVQFLKRLRYVEDAELSFSKRLQGALTFLWLKTFLRKKLPKLPKD